jgi:hypothetical protein
MPISEGAAPTCSVCDAMDGLVSPPRPHTQPRSLGRAVSLFRNAGIQEGLLAQERPPPLLYAPTTRLNVMRATWERGFTVVPVETFRQARSMTQEPGMLLTPAEDNRECFATPNLM